VIEDRKLTGAFAPVNGIDIHYEEAGSGPALILLHAGIANLRMWDAQFAAFSTTHRVVRYDLRGFGRTAKPATAFSHRDDLAGLLRERGIESAVIVGASFGGRVAIEFALEYPDMVDALVLVGSALGGYPFSEELDAFEAEIEEAYEAGDYDRAAEVDVRVWVDGPRRTPKQVDPEFRARAHELARSVYTASDDGGSPNRMEPPAIERLRELRVPVLVVAGDLDQPDILRIADKLEMEIHNARPVFIHGTAHLPSMEQPEKFNRVLREFLDSLNAPPASGVSLREIGQQNWQAVVDLELEEDQRGFLEPNAVSLAESRFHPWMLPLAIYNDDEVVGFVMFSQWPDPREGNYWIHRFMIDRRHQGKGFGTAAMEALLDLFRTRIPACRTLWIGYDARNTPAQQFYARLGFVEQGEAPWGGDYCAKIELE
jgi:pimeloyl-ACP methyl ester carboxylesterase/RimJ/RimL family protein N-acetyltransferase